MPSSIRLIAPFDAGFVPSGAGLSLDPRGAAQLAVVTDGRCEGRPARVICTPATARVLQRTRRRATYLPAPPHRPFTVGPVDVELVPSGSVPGGAQALLRFRGCTALHVRRILPDRIWPTETLAAPRADVVLLDAPGGLPPEAYTRRADTLAAVRAWAERSLARSAIPVVLAEPTMTAPAIVLALGDLGCEIRLHRAIHETVQAYASTGVETPARAFQLRGQARLGQIVVLPWPAGGRPLFERIPGRAVALVHDGAAPVAAGSGIEEVFVTAFSAGPVELVGHVQRVGAVEVHVSPETPAAVGDMLRDLGVPTVVREGPPEQVTFAS